MLKLIQFVILLASTLSIAKPLPTLITDHQNNTLLWAKVCKAILTADPKEESFNLVVEGTPRVHVEGSLHPELRKKFHEGYFRELTHRNRSHPKEPFSERNLLQDLNNETLQVLEFTTSPSSRTFTLIYSWRFQGITFQLSNFSPYPFQLSNSIDAHQSTRTITLHPPHPFFEAEKPSVSNLRALYHAGHLSHTQNGFKIDPNHNQFTFFFVPYSEDEIKNAPPTDKLFMEGFNKEYIFADHVLKTEGTAVTVIESKAQSLYDRNKDLKPTDTLIIPKIHHKVWVTDPENPRELPEEYFVWWENSLKYLKTASGWQHWLWIEDEKRLPETVKRATALGIEIKSIYKDCPSIDLYKTAITIGLQNKWYSIPSNVLRINLLNEFGGVWMDTDYEVYKDLTPLCYTYDLCVGHEPGAAKIGNSIILSKPHHPLLNRSLDLILRNHTTYVQPTYLNNPNPFYTPQQTFSHFGSGTMLFTLAFALEPLDDKRKDIVFPPNIFYPTHCKTYPVGCHDVIRPDETPPAESYGVHYWELSWTTEKSQLKVKQY